MLPQRPPEARRSTAVPSPRPLHPAQLPGRPRRTPGHAGAGRYRLLLRALLTLALAGLAANGAAQRAVIHKCTQPDGRTEYSNVPCGPDERIDYITGDSFSVIDRDPRGGEGAVAPPLSPRALRRQRHMEQEARERGR
jgi:hypothetical protein